jgi:hypothetical protein
LGIIQGIGLGFREDLVMAIPPSIFVLCGCSFMAGRIKILKRGAGIVLMLALFTTASGPILLSYARTQSAMPDAVLGLATSHEEAMGLQHASYERMVSQQDLYVEATYEVHARRVQMEKDADSWLGRNADFVRSRFLMDCIGTFPADMLARAYASAWNALGGLYIPALVLLLISFRDLRLAALLLFGVLYFGAYNAIQFQPRHFFHLIIIPLWCRGFLIEQALAYCQARSQNPVSRGFGERVHTFCRNYGWKLTGRAGLVALSLLVFVAALYGCRSIQHRDLTELVQAYRDAPREPVPLERQDSEQGVLFRASGPREKAKSVVTSGGWVGNYFEAEFSPEPVQQSFRICFEGSEGGDFSRVVTLPQTAPDTHGARRYLFPVYEKAATGTGSDWSRFVGIGIPRELAGSFKGLNRIATDETLRLWPSLYLPADPQDFVWCQRLPKRNLLAELAGVYGYNLPPTPRIALRAAYDGMRTAIGCTIQYLAAGVALLLCYAAIRLKNSGRLHGAWGRIRASRKG